jgi:hypothetical protein
VRGKFPQFSKILIRGRAGDIPAETYFIYKQFIYIIKKAVKKKYIYSIYIR